MPNRVVFARLLALASLMGFAVLATGCGGESATGDVEKIQVTLTQLEITITNTSGGPLSDVVAEIEPVGPASHFIARLGTLTNSEKRRLAHISFSDKDAVPFSMRNTKATRITVSGNAVDGTPVRVSVPFKL
jgi:hypothetical protein